MADVIVGVDGSEAGGRAVSVAARFARQEPKGGRVVVVYVVPWSPYSVQTPEENERRRITKKQEVEHAWREFVTPVLTTLETDGVAAEGVVRHGHAAETMCDLAHERRAEHIVVGRRGQSRVRSLLFGSTPGNLIQIANVPVTVVP